MLYSDSSEFQLCEACILHCICHRRLWHWKSWTPDSYLNLVISAVWMCLVGERLSFICLFLSPWLSYYIIKYHFMLGVIPYLTMWSLRWSRKKQENKQEKSKQKNLSWPREEPHGCGEASLKVHWNMFCFLLRLLSCEHGHSYSFKNTEKQSGLAAFLWLCHNVESFKSTC